MQKKKKNAGRSPGVMFIFRLHTYILSRDRNMQCLTEAQWRCAYNSANDQFCMRWICAIISVIISAVAVAVAFLWVAVRRQRFFEVDVGRRTRLFAIAEFALVRNIYEIMRWCAIRLYNSHNMSIWYTQSPIWYTQSPYSVLLTVLRACRLHY